MTDNNTYLPDGVFSSESRRSFLKKSAIATASVSAASSGAVSAQDGGGDIGEGPWKALIFQNDFHPNARFTIISKIIDWNPNYAGIDDSWFSNYNTRMIRWLNTGEHAQLFVANNAEVGQYDGDLGFITDDQEQNQPQVYEVSPEWSLFEDDPRLATINFGPVEEQTEDQILGTDGWWQDQQGTGTTGGNMTTGGNNTTTGGNNTTTGGN